MEEGVWRTIKGRKVFIKKGQNLSDAMRESGKFENSPLAKYRTAIDEDKDLNYKQIYDDYVAWYNKQDKDTIKTVMDKFDEYCNDDNFSNNPIGNYLNEKTGYDSKPELISEDEFLNSNEKNRIYRGVRTQKYVDEFKNGDYFAGQGFDANGTYFTISDNEAMLYANHEKSNMIYGVIKDDAKIGKLSNIQSLKYSITSQFDWSNLNEESETFYNFTNAIFSDNGYTAQMFGYDILDMEDSRRVVLNRNSIKVVK